jgi:hypothetical protein
MGVIMIVRRCRIQPFIENKKVEILSVDIIRTQSVETVEMRKMLESEESKD